MAIAKRSKETSGSRKGAAATRAAPPSSPAPSTSSSSAGPASTPHVSHLTRDELEAFKRALMSEKEKILEKARTTMASGNIALDKNEMYDEVDLASATIEQNLMFRLLDRDRKLLTEINHALNKLDTGEFGICEGTGEPIPKRRLELRPWCRHSVKYKEQLERLKKSGRGVAEEDEVEEDL